MSISVDWGDFEETVIVWRFAGKWSAEDFYHALDTVASMASSRPQVDLLVDMSYSILAPNHLPSLIRAGIKRDIPNVHKVVVITKSNFWTRMYEVVERNPPVPLMKKVHFVKHVDEAYHYLGV